MAFASEPVVASLANLLRLDAVDQRTRTHDPKVGVPLTLPCVLMMDGYY